jgi:hypothetical protein
VIRLATLAWQARPGHGDGALASLMGTLEAARPGGEPAPRRRPTSSVLQALGAGRDAGRLRRPGRGAGPAGRRPGRLRDAAASGPDDEPKLRRHLGSEVMRERAIWLLATADDRF